MITLTHRSVRVPALGFGTYPMRGAQCADAVRRALDTGYRHIDTAQDYENEDAVGCAIGASGIPRGEIFLTTKVGNARMTARRVADELAISLDKLGTAPDLLLLHWPSATVPMAETLGAMAEAQRAGHARLLGVANFTLALLREASEIHAPALGIDLFAHQFESHPLLRQPRIEAATRAAGMLATAHSPIARGRVVDNPVLAAIGAKYGKSAVQVALRWQLDKPDTMLVPKSTRPAGIAENFAVFDFTLDADDRAAIETLPNGRRGSRPPWEPDWDPVG
jgi:diketogulonate reductase-like aldo/keto reductase